MMRPSFDGEDIFLHRSGEEEKDIWLTQYSSLDTAIVGARRTFYFIL
jgi:hypothetical protein